MRLVTGIITVLLSLARHLNGTKILSIIMVLFVFCVIWESVASLRSGAHVLERWTETNYPDQSQDQSHAEKLSKRMRTVELLYLERCETKGHSRRRYAP